MLEFHTLDVFTKDAYAGNPLAVVLGADELSTAQMQTIAREFNLSETIFVQAPDNPTHTAKVRIFFPTAEIPFAGHPTVGCAILLAEMLNPRGDFKMDITLEEVAGLVPVRVWREHGISHAEFTAPIIPFAHDGATPNVKQAAIALGLTETDIGFDKHQCGVWQGGPAFIYIPTTSREALTKARVVNPELAKITQAGKTNSVYLYCRDGDGYSARMFAPNDGIYEDPATGSASAILAAQLLASADLGDGINQVSLKQGEDMGRPSQIALSVDVTRGKIEAVRIGGAAVRVSNGSLQPPLPE